MCTYMKHMARYKDKDFKGKCFDAIKQMHSKESAKSQKIEDDAEKAELKACLEIVPGDDSAVNIESSATKYPIIFSTMLDDFDRQDVLDLYRLVKERVKSTSLEGYDRLLLGDLITLFEQTCGSVSLEFKTIFKFCLMSLNVSLNFKNEYVALTAAQLEYDGNAIDLSCMFKPTISLLDGLAVGLLYSGLTILTVKYDLIKWIESSVLLMQSRVMTLSKQFQLGFDVHMSMMTPLDVIIMEGEMFSRVSVWEEDEEKEPTSWEGVNTQLDIAQEVQSKIHIKVEWDKDSLVHSFRVLSALSRSGLRTDSTDAKPCQGDSSEFYLITSKKYEHVGPKVTISQDDKRSHDDDLRLCLADDLMKAQDHITRQDEGTCSSLKTELTTTYYYKIIIKVQRLRAKTKDVHRMNDLVPLRSDTIRLVQNGCSFHGLRSEDPNQHLKDFLKIMDSIDLNVETRERTCLRLTPKVPHHGIDLWLQIQIFYDHVNPITRQTIDQAAGGKLRDKNDEESWALLEDLALYDNESWNDPRDFTKLVKAIYMPQDVPSTSDRRLIELENQVQRIMEAHLSQSKPVQVNKIASSCEIYSGPHDTQCYMEDPE
ncbi:hypothetical protein Tco_1183738 [Tanacetum coccineum]